MGIFDFLFEGPSDLDVDAYVKVKLDEAADWRAREWEKLEARQEHVRDLNDELGHLVDQAK